MSSALVQLAGISAVLFLVQGLAALPWLRVVSRRPLVEHLPLVGGAAALGAVLFTVFADYYSDATVLAQAGRVYAAVLQVQLTLDGFVLFFWALLAVWPKGGAVALAGFQEGVRQPMFWLLAILGSLVMVVSVFIPYFTFGEDLKMVKELCYAFTMLGPAIFGVAAACTSVTEEIEGRTAVTLMSKPVSRRQFLLGKFAGIGSAALFMTAIMGWVLVWVVLYKNWYESKLPGNQVDTGDPAWVLSLVDATFSGSVAGDLVRGIGLWLSDAGSAAPGLLIGFGQVGILTAVAVALATRVPMVLNLTICLLVYMLGHLTPIMTEVSRAAYPLVLFVAQFFEFILPGLDLFDVGSAVVRDMPLPPVGYSIHALNLTLYALTYIAIALLAGLVLFEDRDLA